MKEVSKVEVSLMDQIKAAIEKSAPMTLAQIVTEEIREFRHSPQYHEMLAAERYYNNRSDVQRKTNELAGHSNVKMEHPVLRKIIGQKASFLLAKPFSVSTEDAAYADALNRIFDRSFRKKLRLFVTDAVKYGIAWMQPYVDDNGDLAFVRIPATQVIPIWEDDEHERLQAFIRVYPQTIYVGTRKQEITHAELWTTEGVKYFVSSGGPGGVHEFVVDKEHGDETSDYTEPHFYYKKKPMNWESVPVIWLKYNDEERSLCYYLREMIDEINWQNSVTADELRDIAKFIYVLKNYGGTNLDEFVSDLRHYMAISVVDDGGVDKLTSDINIDAVMSFLDNTRRDLYDLASAVDTKDPDLGNASGTAIQFRYMDLQTDCEALGDELQDSFQRLKLFLDTYFVIISAGDFTGSAFEIVFNMDLPVNETDIITNIRSSDGIISRRTQLEQHPWVKDVDEELDRLDKEQQENMEKYGGGLFDSGVTGDEQS